MKINLAAFMGPKDAAAFLARGNARALKGEYDKAIRDFNQTIRLNPELAVVLSVVDVANTAR